MLKFLRRTALYIVAVPLLLFFLGSASNQLVLNVNNDTFPVHISAAKVLKAETGETVELIGGAKLVGDVLILSDGTQMLDYTHCVMTSKTHLNFLADVIDLKDQGIESVGDVLIDFGLWSGSFAPFIWATVVLFKLRDKERQ
jgi:hypothetical protein